MEDAELASLNEQIKRDEALVMRKTTVKPCGHCHNCTAPLGSSEIFCPGGDCAEDWQKRQDAHTRNGD